jgi:flagellar hook-associated protein 2
MASISSLGAGSNLDLESLVTKIIDAEKKPATDRLNLKETTLNSQVSAIGALKSSLSTFQTAFASLKNASTFNTKTAVSSDTTLFTATSTSDAEVGGYTIEVLNLAKANKVASGNFGGPTATVGSGTLNIGGSAPFSVNITAGVNDTLTGVRDAINNASGNTGVRASLLTVSDGVGGTNTKLVLTSTATGTNGQISVNVTDDDGNNTDSAGLSRLFYVKGDAASQLSEVDPAQDAKITIDGFESTSTTNQFVDAIPGVTITALKGTPADATTPLSGTLTLANDKAGIKKAVEGFVAAFNEYQTIFNKLTDVDSTNNTRGLLTGDSSANVLESRIRNIFSSPVGTAAADFSSLSFLGIATNKDGSLKLDSTKLATALDTRLGDIGKIFTGSEGVAGKLDALVSDALSSDGLVSTRQKTLTDQLKKVDDQRSALDVRLTTLEARYRKQFAALDSLVAQLNSTGTFLTQQLDASAKIVSRNSQ